MKTEDKQKPQSARKSMSWYPCKTQDTTGDFRAQHSKAENSSMLPDVSLTCPNFKKIKSITTWVNSQKKMYCS